MNYKFNFESLGDFINCIAPTLNDEFKQSAENESAEITESRIQSRSKWYGVDSFAGALSLARDGYQLAIDNINLNLGDSCGQAMARRNVRGVVGQPVAALALSGSPMCYTMRKSQFTTKKQINLYLGLGYCCDTSADSIFALGQKIVSLVEGLKREYEINIIAICGATGLKGESLITTINLYNSQNALSVASLSFALAHPALIRVFFLRQINTLKKWRHLSGRVMSADTIKSHIKTATESVGESFYIHYDSAVHGFEPKEIEKYKI